MEAAAVPVATGCLAETNRAKDSIWLLGRTRKGVAQGRWERLTHDISQYWLPPPCLIYILFVVLKIAYAGLLFLRVQCCLSFVKPQSMWLYSHSLKISVWRPDLCFCSSVGETFNVSFYKLALPMAATLVISIILMEWLINWESDLSPHVSTRIWIT